jgi:hypothetical protein
MLFVQLRIADNHSTMSSYELGAEVPHEEVDDLESENIQSWREGNESTRFDRARPRRDPRDGFRC